MKKILIKNLTITYDKLVVLKDFNAEFNNGIHWIQGHNGSGKSSLLKSLCGINPVNRGMVSICGHDIVNQAINAKSKLCFVADKPDVYPFIKGMQFLKMVAKIKGVNLSRELYDWLDAINLSQYKDTDFSQMSFGTRRKFTLSTAFIGNPQVLLLDEPFNGLDKETIKQFELWLQKVKNDKCLLVVSHDAHILEELKNSSMVLD